jgi:sulfate permease, SulP family
MVPDGDRTRDPLAEGWLMDRPGVPRTPKRIRGVVLGSARRSGRAFRAGIPTPAILRAELVPSLSRAVGSVPDGMAGGVLAGVDPIYGLYASIVGPILGGLTASTQRMIVTTTSAAAIAVAGTLGTLQGQARTDTLFLVVLFVGVVQVGAGIARLGRFTSFVSHSVMVGFLGGIAVLMILGQLGNLTGFHSTASSALLRAADTVLHLGSIDVPSFLVGLLGLALVVYLPTTRLRAFGVLVALIVPSLVVAVLSLSTVQVVHDIGDFGRGLPAPSMPRFSLLTVDVITGAVAIAVIALVQGAGVSQSVSNVDGSRPNASRDFLAQGVANVGSSLFQGLPLGGSVGQTAFNTLVGARTRWASVLSGLWVAAILLLIPGLIGLVPLPALAALLIVAGVRTINLVEGRSIWLTSAQSRIAIVVTFLSTLTLPIQVAVAIGASLSAILYLDESSTDISIRELVLRPDGLMEERRAPRHLESDTVTTLMVYGSLFYAGARTLERRLPPPGRARRPVVVLRLRGRTRIGSTLIDVLAAYAGILAEAGGRLYLSGVDEHVRAQIRRSQKLDEEGPVRIFAATNVVGESTGSARADAEAWLVGPDDGTAD